MCITFCPIRKQLLNHNKNDNYETKDEGGNTTTDPEEIREHVANHFEDLYQAREGEDSHTQWTEHINKTVKTLIRKKSVGSLYEAFIEANVETRKNIPTNT
jgi:hypothetical protein